MTFVIVDVSFGIGLTKKFLDCHIRVRFTTQDFLSYPLSLLPSSYSRTSTMEAPWAHSAQQVLQHFDVNPEIGLSNSQVEKHVKVYGKNGTYRGYYSP